MTLVYLRQHASALQKACRHLSRYGSAYRALSDLWADVFLPRTTKIIGVEAARSCSLCGVTLPSAHALAAHIHRKHSVVNCLTQFTCGTVCLWCNVEQHSTDRLKYHLRVTPLCLLGLRVTVGPAYIYGTGSKRSGRRGHRGLPPVRIPGPVNATPAQRTAAAEGRVCSEDDLRAERMQVLGVADIYDWPDAGIPDEQGLRPAAGTPPGSFPPVSTVPPVEASAFPSAATAPNSAAHVVCWAKVITEASVATIPSTWPVVSPLWKGMLLRTVAWQLPTDWHRLWTLWWTIHTMHPWALSARQGFRQLRYALDASEMTRASLDKGPPVEVRSLLAATVTFRMICWHVCHGGAVWIPGVPSRVGVQLWRSLMPAAIFRSVMTPAGRCFGANCASGPPSFWSRLSSIRDFSSLPDDGLAIRDSFVFRSSSASAAGARS